MASREECLAAAHKPADDALLLHPFYRGKIQVLPKCPIRDLRDFAIWYTPGVAAPCKAIQTEPEKVYEYTNKGNTIAVISDGTRVLGLGDIGPSAALPVMEGKALLFKYLGGVDAIPICLATKDSEQFIRTVELLEPSLGGINLEDIAQPKCFRILDALRATLSIPVWHDDQQGTAVVALAGLMNALALVDKQPANVRIALVGMGAANVAVYRMLKAAGIDPAQIIACDSLGVLHEKRRDIAEQRESFAEKWRVCRETNPEGLRGGIREALQDADVCLAFSRSGPGIIQPDWIRGMAKDPIVFACANPIPELWPWEAAEAGVRIFATGRSDFPNQVNNSLVFPGIFRGILDVRARAISDSVGLAAARELAGFAMERGIRDDCLLPRMDEWEVYPRIAVSVAWQAQSEGLARLSRSRETLLEEATRTILDARRATESLMREGLIRDITARGKS